MALILSATDEQHAKLWLKIFIRTAKKAPSELQMGTELINGPYVSSDVSGTAIKHIVDGIEDIWSCIVNRTWLFMDDALVNMANGDTVSKRIPYILPHTGQIVTFSPTQLAAALAYMCQIHQIYWDDLDPDYISTQIDSFKRTTFGKALKAADCFVSQQVKLRGTSTKASTPTTNPASTTPTTTSAATTTNPTATAATQGTGAIHVNGNTSRRITGTAKIPYKTSGPQAGNVPALIGTPGKKISPMQSQYWVVSCKSKKNNKRNYAFCYPINGPYGPLKMQNGGAEILWGDPSGYTSCVLYFRNEQQASDILNILNNKYAGTTAWQIAQDSGVSVVGAKADPNGYYEIILQNGMTAFIRATNLNQKLIKE